MKQTLLLFATALVCSFQSLAQTPAIYNNGAHIKATSGTYFVIDNGNYTLNSASATYLAQLANLTITADASLTLPANSFLTVSGTMANNSGTAGFLIQSTASGTGSLIHETTGVDATAQRYIPKYVSDSTGWHYLSSPVSMQAIRPEFVENGNPVPGNNDFYKWDELTDYWINTKDNSGNWNTSFEDNFIVGQGYAVAYQSNENKTFVGDLNAGDFTFDGTTAPAITFTAEAGTGWNLMGNPYPSGLDWDLCQRFNIDAAVYVYDGNNGQYISWNGTVGALAEGIVPPMNAFFIKASQNPELTISNEARVHTTANFYKSQSFINDLLVLKVVGNGFSDKTYIHFNPQATNNFDSDYDAYKLAGIAAAPQLCTKTGDTRLSINELPYSEEEIIIPLSIKIGKDGNYTLSVVQNTFWNTVDIELRDLQTQISYDLRTTAQLAFMLSTNNPDRFLIIINGATAIEENQHDNGIEIFSYGNQVFIKTDEAGEAEVSVYNMLGQLVLHRNLSAFHSAHTKLTGFNIGYYVLTVRTEKAWATKKVFIK